MITCGGLQSDKLSEKSGCKMQKILTIYNNNIKNHKN
jgi:hypothetical protein